MTPQLYIKLVEQTERQTIEVNSLIPQLFSMQPAIDSAQVWVDSCTASVASAKDTLDSLAQVEDADTTEQQAALNEANKTLEAARTDLSVLTEPRDALRNKIDSLTANIAHCQSLIAVSGLTQEDITTFQTTESQIEADKIEANRQSMLWEAAHKYESSYISGVGLTILAVGFAMGKPKAQAVGMWSKTLWDDTYYPRKNSGSTDYDFSVVGPIPFTVTELSGELGL